MPSKSRATAEIPVININSEGAASRLLDAAASHGFVFVENNEAGIPVKDIQDMFDLSKDFFSSPTSVKEECAINSSKSGKNQGWLSMHTETLDPGNQKRGDFKEAFNIGEYHDGKPQQPFPAPLKPYRSQVGAFETSCHALCNRILRLFAVALSIEEDWFTSRHDQAKGASGSVLRLLYYPSVGGLAADEEDIRAGAHSDYGSVTLLFQLPGQPGLEILTPEKEWVSVPVDPTLTFRADGYDEGSPSAPVKALPILVNIGDLLSYWTNGVLRSTVHRVIFPKDARRGGEDRYSMAYFCHPLDDAALVSVPSALVRAQAAAPADGKEGGEKGRAMTARDHLNSRLAATYGIKTEAA